MSKPNKSLNISTDQSLFTVINRFIPAAENQLELVKVLTDGISNEMAIQPGFRSAAIHCSTDSNDVLVYAQWESADALAAAAKVVQQGGAPSMARGFELGQPQYHPYEIAAVIVA